MRGRRIVLVTAVVSLFAGGIAVLMKPPAGSARISYGIATTEIRVPNGDRSLPTTIYRPDGGPRAWPLVVFAHGYNTDPSTYDLLLRTWASAGYLVAAPASPGIDPRLGRVSTSNLPEQAGDISATITFVLNGGADEIVDPNRVAVAGHSDGGSTATRMALGQSQRDDRVSAFVVLSGALDIPDRYGPTNTVPLFASVGTEDEYGNYSGTRRVYDTAASPKVFVSIEGGDHLDPYIGDGVRGASLRTATVDFLDGALDVHRLAWDDLGVDANRDGLSLENDGAPIPDPSDPMLVLARSSASSGPADMMLPFGIRRDRILFGDWNGDGVKTVGVWRDATATFFLSNDNTHTAAVVPFGDPGDNPIVGDWTGSGLDTIGVQRQGQWFLRYTNEPGPADASFSFGDPMDVPVVGNWRGRQGATTVGVHRGDHWYLRDTNTSGTADHTFVYGDVADDPVVGDWNCDGITTIGVHRGDHWYLRDTNTSGAANHRFAFGDVGDDPVVGDWNCDGITTVGVHRGDHWYLRDTNTSGAAGRSFVYGDPSDTPVVARFGRSTCTTVAVVR
jgi:poly(3-hydroxybutyrate) depolymerase